MKNKLLTFLFFLLLPSICCAGEVYIDGKSFDEFDVIGFKGISSFGVSPTNSARLYYDSEDNKLKLSENGGAYANIGGGYTNLTSFVSQTPWRIFYSNSLGDITELALGGNGTYLMSNGATSAPTFETPAGTGDVTSVGDCATGACFDGTSDGGTYLDFYDAQGRTRLIGGNTAGEVNITLPNTTGTLIHTEVDPTVDTANKIEAILTNDAMDFGTGIITTPKVQFGGATTYIDYSGNDIRFTDVANGTKTLAQLLDPEADMYYWDGDSWEPQGKIALDASVDQLEGYVDTIETVLGTINTDTGNIATSVGLVDDTVYIDGTGTPSKGLLIMGSDATNPQAIITDATGHLQIDVLTAPTTAVTGTFWQATQPVSGTFWQTTQPISVASLPLPTGASTSALQGGGLPAALATGGGLKVEGVAGGVAQPVSGTFWQATQPVSLASVAVTNAGTFVTQENGAALTALQLIDNAISGAGFNITQFGGAAVPIGAGLEATAVRVTLPTDGTGVVKLGAGTAEIGKLAAGTAEIGNVKNAGTFATQATLAAETTKVIGTINVAASQTIGLSAGTAEIGKLAAGTAAIGKLAANSGVDIGDVDVLSIAAGNNNIGDVDVASIAAGNNNIGDVDIASGTITTVTTLTGTTTLTPGTAATNLGKAEDAIHTTGDTGVMALAVSNEANTVRAADGDYLPIGTDAEGSIRNVGNRDHDAVDAGEPVKVGMKAIAYGTNPTAVAAADRTDWYANRAGIPFVIAGHPNIVTLRANYTAAQTDTAIVTVAAGLKIVVTRCSVTADNANTVDVQVRIGFAAATTPTTTGVVLSHPGIAAGSGMVEGAGAGILGVGADGEDLRITSEEPTTGSIDVVVSYFTIES